MNYRSLVNHVAVVSCGIWFSTAYLFTDPANSATGDLLPPAVATETRPIPQTSLAVDSAVGFCPTALELEVLTEVNKHRADSGRVLLQMDGRLVRTTRNHCEDMANNSCYQHNSCNGQTFTQVSSIFHPSVNIQMIGSSFPTGKALVDAFMASEPHRTYLMQANLRTMGAGLFYASGNIPRWTVHFSTLSTVQAPECEGLCAGQFEDSVIALINKHRADSGKASLVRDVRLIHSARIHSEDMEGFAYTGTGSYYGTPYKKRIASHGYNDTTVACLWGTGSATPVAVVNAWMASAPNRAILLGASWKHIGIGFETPSFWTADLGGKIAAPKTGCTCCEGTRGNVNESVAETPDLSDLALMISYLTVLPRPALPCPDEANVNGSATISPDLSDLSLLVAYLTTTPRPTLLNCP